jgi:hypothetical protein
MPLGSIIYKQELENRGHVRNEEKILTLTLMPFGILILFIFNEAKSPFTKEPLTAIAKRNPAAKRITEEIKVYNEEDLLEIAEDKV